MNDVSRRNVLKAAAWSTPVMAIAIATPAAAASAPSCKREVYEFGKDDLTAHDVATMIIVTGEYVVFEFEKDYPNATAINVNGRIDKKYDNGAKKGEKHTVSLKAHGICDPTLIQVDGNNTHYYGGGVFR